MKKMLWIPALVLAAALAITGCGNKQEPQEDYSKYVTLGEYKGVEIEDQSAAPVSDEDIAAQVELFRSSYQTLTVVEREAEMGDTVNIDYVGYIDGEAFEHGADTGFDLLLGSHSFIDTFEDQLVGTKKGDKVEVNVTFPDGYGRGMDNQEAMFEVTVNEVKERSLPEYSDELVAANTSFTNVADFEADLRERMQASRDQAAAEDRQAAVVMKIIENCTYGELPADRIATYEEQLSNYYDSLAAAYGLTRENLLAQIGMDEAGINETAVEMTKQYVTVMAIAQNEKMSISDDEYKTGLAGYLEEYGVGEDEFLEYYSKEEVVDMLLTDKVTAFLVENCVEK